MKRAQVLREESPLGSFEEVARRWIDTKRHEWTEGYCHALFLRLHVHVFPVSGYRPLKDISPKMMLEAFRRVQACGHLDTAHRMRENSSQVFRFAISEGLDPQDPCADISDALKKPIVIHRSAVSFARRPGRAVYVPRARPSIHPVDWETSARGFGAWSKSGAAPKAWLQAREPAGHGYLWSREHVRAGGPHQNVGDLQGQAFAQTQSHALEREENTLGNSTPEWRQTALALIPR